MDLRVRLQIKVEAMPYGKRELPMMNDE